MSLVWQSKVSFRCPVKVILNPQPSCRALHTYLQVSLPKHYPLMGDCNFYLVCLNTIIYFRKQKALIVLSRKNYYRGMQFLSQIISSVFQVTVVVLQQGQGFLWVVPMLREMSSTGLYQAHFCMLTHPTCGTVLKRSSSQKNTSHVWKKHFIRPEICL
jgi:hypothetical protein